MTAATPPERRRAEALRAAAGALDVLNVADVDALLRVAAWVLDEHQAEQDNASSAVCATETDEYRRHALAEWQRRALAAERQRDELDDQAAEWKSRAEQAEQQLATRS
ncbi:hypothetical protein SAMN05421805_12779 [Saccharopolyspora antimicrobica]|uniref:Uncharacterized protein n=1 Tax=Saccharopolyspora antimicrobica TaxID=455193 RepID=A0A1I5KM68_9PSEU|nr:hypothetical protein [Saccharopolyspora antimicrobica]RKT85618.1 hypothetical protein ATL45_3965 [Saccharopolyspora antimicrobica]SFO86105.1 hypothetical protein SAMN05421805_12779 [Saccharopolyspora antimicrobica]